MCLWEMLNRADDCAVVSNTEVDCESAVLFLACYCDF